MAIIINEGFDVNAPSTIDRRLIVDRADGTTSSLVSLTPQYNYPNMYVWVKDEKVFYYLNDIVDDNGSPGATLSDWAQASGGVSGCAKSGYVSGDYFSGPVVASASVVFDTPYSSASYSVVVTSHAFDEFDYVYSVIDKTANGFTIRTDIPGPLGATAMWITNCFDGSGLSSGGGGSAGTQGPTGSLSEGITGSTPFYINDDWTVQSTFLYNDGNQISINGGGLGSVGTPSSYTTSTAEFTVWGTSVFEDDSDAFTRLTHRNWASGPTAAAEISVQSYNHNSDSLVGYSFGSLNSCFTAFPGYGRPGDSFIYSSQAARSLNIIQQNNTNESGWNNNFQNGDIKFFANGDAQSGGGAATPTFRLFGSNDSLPAGGILSGSRELRYGDESTLNLQINSSTDQGYYVITKAASTMTSKWTLTWPVQGPGSYSTIENTVLMFNTSSNTFIWGTAGAFGVVKGLGSESSIDSEEIAFGTGAGITSSNTFTFDSSNVNLISSTGSQITGTSKFSSIISGCSNTIHSSLGSTILGGCQNFIFENSDSSSVISSNCSGHTSSSTRSVIISSLNSCNSGGDNSTIISGICNKISNIVYGSGNSLLMFGACNSIIGSSLQSGILGGCKNIMTASNNSIILGGNNLQINGINNMVYVPSIRGFGSVQFNLATSSTNYTLDADNFTLLAYPSNSGMTVSLPTAISSPHRLYVIKKDGSSTQSIVYIGPSASDTIEGYAGSIELINPWDYNMLQSDGVSMWIKLGGAVGINL